MRKTIAEKRYLSDRDLAERYSIHRGTVWRWVREGHLPSPVTLGPRAKRWPLETIERFEQGEREA